MGDGDRPVLGLRARTSTCAPLRGRSSGRRGPSPWTPPVRSRENIPLSCMSAGATERAAGISQEGLSLVKDKAYSGRIVLAGDAGVTVSVRLVLDSGESLRRPSARSPIEFRDHLPPDFRAPAERTMRGSRSSAAARAASVSARSPSCLPTPSTAGGPRWSRS